MNEVVLNFSWDEHKARLNVVKHGVSFAQAATVLLDKLALSVLDASHSEYKERWFTLGVSDKGKLLAVSHTHQVVGTVTVQIRIIAARHAT